MNKEVKEGGREGRKAADILRDTIKGEGNFIQKPDDIKGREIGGRRGRIRTRIHANKSAVIDSRIERDNFCNRSSHYPEPHYSPGKLYTLDCLRMGKWKS